MRSVTMLPAGRASAFAAAVFLSALALPANAQSTKLQMNGPPPPPGSSMQAAPPGAPVMPPLPDPAKDDPAKVAAARDFVIAFHPQMNPLNVASKIDSFIPQMIQAAKNEDPKLDVKKFAHDRRVLLMQQAADTLDRQSHVVSRHFSLQELNALNEFFHGPLGQKLGEEIPKIQMDIMQQGRMARQQQMSTKPGVGPAKADTAKAAAKPH